MQSVISKKNLAIMCSSIFNLYNINNVHKKSDRRRKHKKQSLLERVISTARTLHALFLFDFKTFNTTN